MKTKGSILFAGCEYYNTWYLSRELRKYGWEANLLNWDSNKESWHHYHGWDYLFKYDSEKDLMYQFDFFLKILDKYDIFHFSNKDGLTFGTIINQFFKKYMPINEIEYIKSLGKKILYTNNGCFDGVLQSSFSKWGPYNTCNICKWQEVPEVCSDEGNAKWGKFRNELADFQCILGGNRKDYNDNKNVHEVPEFYCLDSNFWKPNLKIPNQFKFQDSGKVKIFHSISNKKQRTRKGGVDIKCSHIYEPLFKELINEGFPIEPISVSDLKNDEVRYIQVQADIVVDMLTFGFFGANIREALMLGKTCVCFLRPEWLDSMREQIPDYVEELPVISATPETIKTVLIDLIQNPQKRIDLGKKGRKFALKWHSAKSGGKKMDEIYSSILNSRI